MADIPWRTRRAVWHFRLALRKSCPQMQLGNHDKLISSSTPNYPKLSSFQQHNVEWYISIHLKYLSIAFLPTKAPKVIHNVLNLLKKTGWRLILNKSLNVGGFVVFCFFVRLSLQGCMLPLKFWLQGTFLGWCQSIGGVTNGSFSSSEFTESPTLLCCIFPAVYSLLRPIGESSPSYSQFDLFVSKENEMFLFFLQRLSQNEFFWLNVS